VDSWIARFCKTLVLRVAGVGLKVLDWIFQNTNELHEYKKEGTDKKPVPSVSVPLSELLSEPFLMDLDLIWCVDCRIKTFEDKGRETNFV
jgi:hypothetical protein